LNNVSFFTINVKVQRDAIYNWIYFEVYTKSINKAAHNIPLFKHAIHGHINQHGNDIIVRSSRTHNYRDWVIDPEGYIEPCISSIGILAFNKAPHYYCHYQVKNAEYNFTCKWVDDVIQNADIGCDRSVAVGMPFIG